MKNPKLASLLSKKNAFRAVFAVIIGLIIYGVGTAWRDSIAVARIRNLGGMVDVHHDWPEWISEDSSDWLYCKFGKVQIAFAETDLDDSQLKSLGYEMKRFKHVKTFAIAGSTVSDNWLKQLGPMDNVKLLVLEQTEVTPVGCKELTEWRNLKILWLKGSPHLTDVNIRFLRTKSPSLELYFSD